MAELVAAAAVTLGFLGIAAALGLLMGLLALRRLRLMHKTLIGIHNEARVITSRGLGTGERIELVIDTFGNSAERALRLLDTIERNTSKGN